MQRKNGQTLQEHQAEYIKAMNFIIGQDSKVDGASSRWNTGSTSYKTNAYLAEDDEAWPDDEVYLEWDDYEAEGNEVLDGDKTYHDAENDTNPIDNAFNVDEYDDVFASYIDAKNHLNRMRTSRGFYPVVAMVQQPHRYGGKGGKSKKGKGKSSKGKGKPPSSRQMNPPQRGSLSSLRSCRTSSQELPCIRWQKTQGR